MKKVSIIIVNWNGKKDTLECLGSVAMLGFSGIEVEVIVVDNGSTDDSAKEIQDKFPKTIVIQNTKNLGFSGGNNIGIKYALKQNSDFIWLLNNDTKVDTHALLRLVEANGDVVGSKIYFAPGYEYHANRYKKEQRGHVIWYAGGIIDWKNMYASHQGVDEVDKDQYNVNGQTDFVTGCSMLVRSEVFKRIGLFDDRYYLYLEDVDFCLRAQKAGFRLTYQPSSVVWHKNAGSSGGAGSKIHDYYLMRNRFLLGFQFAPLRTKIALLRQAISLLAGKNKEHRRASMDALIGRWGKQYEPIKTHN